MKFMKDVVCSFKPIQIDDKSSNTMIYVRSNIREFKLDDNTFYRYNETQYTKEEYEKVVLNNKISMIEQENADLLLDSAIKDMKIQTIEKDLADLILEVVIGGM